MPTEAGPPGLQLRIETLRAAEPEAYIAAPEAIEAFVSAVQALLTELEASGDAVSDFDRAYLREAAGRQVYIAKARLERDRPGAIETLSRLFRLGRIPAPDGRYDGELIGLSTGLLSDPFFDWLTRIYLPWLGKTFDVASQTGDNVFVDNAWSKVSGKLGWPEYRVPSDDPPGTIRVFPFSTSIAPAIDEPDLRVLRIDYHDEPNPLPVRRIVDELVALPGGYLLGKAHMRGLREFRLICFFGLTRAAG